jgi:hypothetical protein
MNTHEEVTFDETPEGPHLQGEVDILLPSVQGQVLIEPQLIVVHIIYPVSHVAAIEVGHIFQNDRTVPGIIAEDIEALLKAQARSSNVIGEKQTRDAADFGF